MNWTKDQEQALRLLRRPAKMYTIGGYAGTGKTTLINEIICNIFPNAICATPTGKAATVLRSKLERRIPVDTIHHFLYVPNTKSHTLLQEIRALEEQLSTNPAVLDRLLMLKERYQRLPMSFTAKSEHGIGRNSVVIVDEASMVNEEVCRDLVNTGATIIWVGDPGQLPPVRGKDFFERFPPDVVLEEIQRQALNSPIVQLSMAIRQGDQISDCFDYGACRRIPRGSLPPEAWTFDQVLTGKNETRRRINKFYRRSLAGPWPVKGEPLICLKNTRMYEDQGVMFVNGGQALCTQDAVYTDDRIMPSLSLGTTYDGINLFVSAEPYDFEVYYNAKANPPVEQTDNLRLDWAYCITVHKAQGSEWDRVLLCDDHMFMPNDTRRRWLYTAVTRAKEEFVWIS